MISQGTRHVSYPSLQISGKHEFGEQSVSILRSAKALGSGQTRKTRQSSARRTPHNDNKSSRLSTAVSSLINQQNVDGVNGDTSRSIGSEAVNDVFGNIDARTVLGLDTSGTKLDPCETSLIEEAHRVRLMHHLSRFAVIMQSVYFAGRARNWIANSETHEKYRSRIFRENCPSSASSSETCGTKSYCSSLKSEVNLWRPTDITLESTETGAVAYVRRGFPKTDRGLTVGVIGGGKMGQSIVEALLGSAVFQEDAILISTRRPETLFRRYVNHSNVDCFFDNGKLLSQSDIVFLAVPLCTIRTVCESLCEAYAAKLKAKEVPPMIISVVPGVPKKKLRNLIRANEENGGGFFTPYVDYTYLNECCSPCKYMLLDVKKLCTDHWEVCIPSSEPNSIPANRTLQYLDNLTQRRLYSLGQLTDELITWCSSDLSAKERSRAASQVLFSDSNLLDCMENETVLRKFFPKRSRNGTHSTEEGQQREENIERKHEALLHVFQQGLHEIINSNGWIITDRPISTFLQC